MAVGNCNVSSYTKKDFDDVMESTIRTENRIQLTLRKASERHYREYEIKFSEFSKKKQLKQAELPLALVVYKDGSKTIPDDLPIRNYDIIQMVRNQT